MRLQRRTSASRQPAGSRQFSCAESFQSRHPVHPEHLCTLSTLCTRESAGLYPPVACFSAMSDVIRDMAAKCRNWGKWGDADERGTLNYITAEAIVHAARLIRRGAVFSLAIPFDSKGPQPPGHPRRFNPIHRMMLTGADYASGALSLPGGVGFSDDMVIMATHGATQWDALSHCFLDGQMYNGFAATEISSQGAKRNSIDKMSRGIVGRGVLIDMPRFKQVRWLEPGYGITADDLERAADA